MLSFATSMNGIRPPIQAARAAARRQRAQRDPGEHRGGARDLPAGRRITEREPAHGRADDGLEVDERARQLGRNPSLSEREQPERQQRPDCGQRAEREHRGGVRRGRRRPIHQHGDRERDEGTRCELHRGHGRRVASREQPRLAHDEPGRQDDRGEHQAVAEGSGAATTATRHERYPRERERVARPVAPPPRTPAEPRREQRDQHGNHADDHRGVAHARVVDTGVLEHDHGAEPDRAAEGDARHERLAEAAPPREREERRGDGEPRHGQPAGAKPRERQLRERDGEAPQRAGGGEREQGWAVASAHVNHDEQICHFWRSRFDR
jgi:hypothetical protein